MLMERRGTARKQAKVQVYVFCPGQGTRRCKTANISGNGVYVHTDSVMCPKGIALELVFVIRRGTLIKIHRRWATVVHVSKSGAGMRFYGNTRPRVAARPQATS
jgi:hypothetical protein